MACVLTGLARTVLTFNEVRDFQVVKELALTDELTGLPNRRALLERAAQTVAAASPNRPAALLLLSWAPAQRTTACRLLWRRVAA